jgi:hypothetical protein
MAPYDAVVELVGVARERPDVWGGWTEGVKRGIDACRDPLMETNDALVLCWQELAECAATDARPAVRLGAAAPNPRGRTR